MKIHMMLQGSEEWFAIKADKMSASHATAIGNNGKGLETYIMDIITTMITGKRKSFKNSDMDRGNELEPIGRAVYEFENNVTVKEVGFIEYNNYAGCSPDGLIGDDGGLELKARNDKIHLGLLLGDKVDSSTIWQMNMNMLVTGRKWWDFGSYNPNFKKSLITERFYPDPIKQQKLKIGLDSGEIMLRNLLNDKNIINELKK